MKPFVLTIFISFTSLASTARAETPCETLSTHLIDALDRGDYAGATADFNATMKTKLSADTLSQVWQAIPPQFGDRGARDAATTIPAGDLTVVLTPLHYGQNTIDSKVTCDAQGKVAEFYIQPHH